MRQANFPAAAGLLWALLAVYSCSSGGVPQATADAPVAPVTSTPDADTSVTAQGEITVAQGGLIGLGNAALQAHPNSVSHNVTITITSSDPGGSVPDRQTLAGRIYDFAPHSTTFHPPAQLTLPIEGTPHAGQTVVISSLEANRWIDLVTRRDSNGATASLDHLGKLACRFVAGTVATADAGRDGGAISSVDAGDARTP